MRNRHGSLVIAARCAALVALMVLGAWGGGSLVSIAFASNEDPGGGQYHCTRYATPWLYSTDSNCFDMAHELFNGSFLTNSWAHRVTNEIMYDRDDYWRQCLGDLNSEGAVVCFSDTYADGFGTNGYRAFLSFTQSYYLKAWCEPLNFWPLYGHCTTQWY